jgi:hypothetical protein
LFSLSLSDILEAFKLYEGLAALSEALVKVARKCDNRIDLLSAKLFFILNQAHSCLHGAAILFLIHLPLTKQEEMNSFCSLPGVGQSLVS